MWENMVETDRPQVTI